jgi:hypothetical protein
MFKTGLGRKQGIFVFFKHLFEWRAAGAKGRHSGRARHMSCSPASSKRNEPAIKHFDNRKEDRNRLLMRRFGVDRVVSSVLRLCPLLPNKADIRLRCNI